MVFMGALKSVLLSFNDGHVSSRTTTYGKLWVLILSVYRYTNLMIATRDMYVNPYRFSDWQT